MMNRRDAMKGVAAGIAAGICSPASARSSTDTIVIFTSDNGPVDRTQGYPARWVRGDTAIHGHEGNGPLGGWKAGLEEGGHRQLGARKLDLRTPRSPLPAPRLSAGHLKGGLFGTPQVSGIVLTFLYAIRTNRLSAGFTLACWLVLAPMALPKNVSAAPGETLRPNILIILADDMGYGDVGILNPDSRIPTPNLDRLAKEGLIFTDAHSSGSYCVPSRYGLLTGRYMWRTRLGSGGNLANFAGTLIEPGRKTLADLLREAGYFTGLVGKWHQGIDWKLHDESARELIRVHPNYQDFQNIDFASPVLKGPKDYGFDDSFGTAGSAEMNPATFIENNRATVIPTLSSREAKAKYGAWYGREDNIIAEGYTMDRLVPTLSKKACEFVQSATRTQPDQPFFLYYAMTAPHNPIVPNREFVGTSRAGAYGDFVVEVDHHVGRILRKIADLGIERNTFVIFTSDNGPVDRTRGYPARWVRGDTAIHGHDSNGPFRGWKAGLEEGGHRVPFFVRWPEEIKPGRCRAAIIFNDVLPTLAEMLNIPLDNHTAEDGESFFQALTGEARPGSFHEAIVHNHAGGTFAIRQGAFKLTVHGPKTTAQVVDDAFPVSFELHDLGQDIQETTDVSRNHPKIVKEMHALLKKYVREGRSTDRR